MTTTYNIAYSHQGGGTPGTLRRDLADDAAACAYVRKLVEDGYRDQTSARTTLSDGRTFEAANKHGAADTATY